MGSFVSTASKFLTVQDTRKTWPDALLFVAEVIGNHGYDDLPTITCQPMFITEEGELEPVLVYQITVSGRIDGKKHTPTYY